MSTLRSKAVNVGSPKLALFLSAVVLLLLVACGNQQQPPPPGGQQARVSGSLVPNLASGDGASATGAAAISLTAAAPGSEPRAAVPVATRSPNASNLDFVPGELIVRFADDGLQASALPRLEAAGQPLTLQRTLAADEMRLYVAPGLDRAATLAAARTLNARPDVLFAHPNYIYHPALAPNDQFYDDQWHYDQINMEAAWDLETGDSNIVVAVLDSGIVPHPDFGSRVLAGYDFVTSISSASDGDGRDPDPYDTTDPSKGLHGTHVAGTIGAATNNSLGVAGVDWNAQILPVRVLGADESGTFGDIADALVWAAGGNVNGVPTNQNPADVINLSLGGEQECLEGWQAVIDEVRVLSSATVIVAAAGNDNINAAGFVPANCEGLITVGATDAAGERASYSNFGSAIDVMAPGGDGSDYVWSLGFNGSSFTYVGMKGTSMATPHISGLVALMKAYAADPDDVDLGVARGALIDSATPLGDAACDNLGAPGRDLVTWDCGFGLVDAALALQNIGSGDPPSPSNVVAFTPVILDLGDSETLVQFTMTNVSGATIDWELVPKLIQDDGNPVDVFWSEFAPASGELDPGEGMVFDLTLDRTSLVANGLYRVWIGFDIAGHGVERYQVRFVHTGGVSNPGPSGPTLVAAFQVDEFGDLYSTGEQMSTSFFNDFSFEVEPGNTMIGAWSDENDDNVVNQGDYLGFLDDFIDVPAGEVVSGLTVVVDRVFGSPAETPHDLSLQLEALRKED